MYMKMTLGAYHVSSLNCHHLW